MQRSTVFGLLTMFLLILPTAVWAQGDTEAVGIPDGTEVIEFVDVPAGSGDGAITVNDVVALAEFTTWMYDRLIQMVDPTVALDADAPARAVLFWNYMWEGLDPETKALISQMDVIFPAARANWESASPMEQEEIAESVRELVMTVWGEHVAATAGYLADEISYDEFVPYMDAIYMGWLNGGVSTDESGESSNGDGEFDDSLHDAVSTYLGNFIVYN